MFRKVREFVKGCVEFAKTDWYKGYFFGCVVATTTCWHVVHKNNAKLKDAMYRCTINQLSDIIESHKNVEESALNTETKKEETPVEEEK